MQLTKKHLPLIALSSLALVTSCSDGEENKPNVLFIILDDAGYNDFGFMGCKDLETPNIDALANSGVVFKDGHVSASVSGPSRAGMLTGRYQQRFGYECNLEGDYGLALTESTMADYFKANGYATACIGKWHQGHTPEYHPHKRGFDHFFGFLSGGRSYFYRPGREDRDGDSHQMQLNGTPFKFDSYLTDVLGDGASQYIAQCADKQKPFMMYLAYNAVHTPMEATKEDLARYKGHPRQKLAAMTWAVDRSIGQVVNTLKEKGIYDNTLIFFISDNGGAHNNQSRNIPLKGFKGNKYEGGHRIPYFMVYGDQFKGEFNGLVSSLDMLPTAAAAAGVNLSQLEKPLDGINLLPYLDGEKYGDPHEVLYWRKDDMAAVRMGDYKLIRVADVGTRLYNLAEDLNEDLDLSSNNPKKHQELNISLDKWEQGLVNPLIWDEGIWNDVTKQIHYDLMHNQPVSCYTPSEYKRIKSKNEALVSK